ncbi:hypothetical protein M422DRAFT_254033 [Sphaerobolus stellatus SS14]|uniref:Uncharacterized protein n=1 Tax=Sphaerobolus stellatus (strain SS14) TaxID=990650 RepID=A0A0C9VMA9_SPHS4|nr:hypothetical protein M422DRAFT_254033 [Sphaerobolus stellatus SS14]
MPAIYSIISFLSFWFFRDYTYYSLVEAVNEVYPPLHVLIAMVLIIFNCHSLSSRLLGCNDQRLLVRPICAPNPDIELTRIQPCRLLLIQYVAATASGSKAENALLRKDKQPLPFPIYFIVALYGLILFYNLTCTELVGRRPLVKFLCIKGIVMLTFYQEFVCPQKYKLIHATEFWTATNVADGLNALTTTIEVRIMSSLLIHIYPRPSLTSFVTDGLLRRLHALGLPCIRIQRRLLTQNKHLETIMG